MDTTQFYRLVSAHLSNGDLGVGARELTHIVFAGLSRYLTADAAAGLRDELPGGLRSLLHDASGDGELDRDAFIEEVAANLDVDDDAAELGVRAVLHSLRRAIEPLSDIDQVLEVLPADLAQFMT